MVDRERVTRLLSDVRADIEFLGRLGARPRNQLTADETALAVVKYGFVTAVEGCARVAHHLSASEGWAAPETNADAFRELARRGVVPGPRGEGLAAAAGFRNVLVDRYTQVDDAAVVSFLDRLGDLESFVGEISAWLEAQPDGGAPGAVSSPAPPVA